MIDTHFTNNDLYFLGAGLLCILLAIWLFQSGHKRYALTVLIAGGFSFRLMMAFIDPFINIWDEQFHALVARNLAQHMLHPTLVENPILPTDPAYWVFTHTWLHKPPLFLWQMALSIKLFGTSYWAIRIPSVLLGTLMIPAIYRMGLLISNERTGFVAALILAASNIHVNIISGFQNTDQNDAVFAAYVLFSFWAWTEYNYRNHRIWIILIGVFAGAAVLTKWLPGLVVFGAWGVALITSRENRKSSVKWFHLLAALFVATLVSFPWFAYAASEWPIEWKTEIHMYAEHFSNDQGHDGPWYFHFHEFYSQFGLVFCAVTVASLFIFAFNKSARLAIRVGYAVSIITVFTFYSLVIARMPFFCLSIIPLLFVMLANFIDSSLTRLDFKKQLPSRIAFAGICIVLTISLIDIGRLEHYHTERDPKEIYRKTRIHNKACFESAAAHIPSNTVIFNCGSWNAVPCMFYTDHTAYDDLPSLEMIQAAREQNRSVAVFDDAHLPEYIFADSSIIILKEPLIRNGF